MENRKNAMVELNEAQMEMVNGGWSLLDLVGAGIEYIEDKMKNTIEIFFGDPNPVKQVMPGFNVY